MSRNTREEIGRYVIPTAQEANLIEHGELGQLAPLADGEGILYASPIPAVVYRIDTDGSVQQLGPNLFPTAQAHRESRNELLVPVTPVGSRGITHLRDGRIALLSKVPVEGSPGETELYFGMLDPAGELIYWAPL